MYSLVTKAHLLEEDKTVRKPFRILGIAGSLRRQSYNRSALRAAQQLAPAGVTVDVFELDGIPLFNEDDERQPPAKVIELKERVRGADAVLLVTPEYNFSMPGVLKNAIDWASRPPDQPFNFKPCAMISASGSLLGGVRAQYHLRHICVSLNCFPLNQPQVYITEAPKKFDAEGRLTDPPTRDLIRTFMTQFKSFTLRWKRGFG